MSLGYNPQFKHQPDILTRQGIERIADFHRIGANGSSGNEVVKIITAQFGKVPAKDFFPALAAISQFQVSHKRPKGRVSPATGQ